MNPFNDLIDFVVANVEPEVIIAFKVSEETHDYVYDLLYKEKAGLATAEERNEFDQFMQVEHIVRVMKAKASQNSLG